MVTFVEVNLEELNQITPTVYSGHHTVSPNPFLEDSAGSFTFPVLFKLQPDGKIRLEDEIVWMGRESEIPDYREEIETLGHFKLFIEDITE